MFLGLTNLVELDLSSNLLTSVPTPTFSGDFKEYFHLHAKNKNCEVFWEIIHDYVSHINTSPWEVL